MNTQYHVSPVCQSGPFDILSEENNKSYHFLGETFSLDKEKYVIKNMFPQLNLKITKNIRNLANRTSNW